MFDSYYDLMKLPHEEADLLVGEACKIEKADCLIIQLDEYFTEMSAFSTNYSVIRIQKYESPNNNYPTFISVGIPGIDDTNFRAYFKPSETIHLSGLMDSIYKWASRTKFRHINCHALEDYCRWLGAYEFDWN